MIKLLDILYEIYSIDKVTELKRKKTLHVYDFDDTLVKTDIPVIVIDKEGNKKEINSHEFATHQLQPGEKYDFYVAYCRNPATWSPKNIDMFKTWAQSAKYPVWLLTSAHAIKSSLAQFREHDLVQWAKKCCFILTHPRQETVLIQGLNELITVLS